MSKEELEEFCDGSCLEHADPHYCLDVCPYKELWRKLKSL